MTNSINILKCNVVAYQFGDMGPDGSMASDLDLLCRSPPTLYYYLCDLTCSHCVFSSKVYALAKGGITLNVIMVSNAEQRKPSLVNTDVEIFT